MNITSILRPTNGHTKKAEDEKYSVIYSTYDYEKFKFLDTNRDINETNYRGLVSSFQDGYLLALIIVNENYEIIDGQHRFNAAKELGLPVRYTIAPGYGIDEVRQYNKTMQRWVKLNYMDSFATEGKPAYVELKEFMKEFPEFGIQVSLKLLTGLSRGEAQYVDNGKSVSTKNFMSGKLKLESVHKAYINARKIIDFKEYYQLYNSPTFVSSVLSIMKKKCYDHKRMMQKLKYCPHRLDKCGNQEQYRALLQKIYNYKTSADDRADFINV